MSQSVGFSVERIDVMLRSSESLPRRISDASAGAFDHSNGFMAATMVPLENNEPKKVTQTFNALMEPSPEDPCSPPTTSVLGIAAPIAPRRNRRSKDKMLAKAVLYADDEIFQRFIENILIDVTPAALEAKRVRQMQARIGDWLNSSTSEVERSLRRTCFARQCAGPISTTKATLSILEANLGEATLLGFDKEWIKSVRVKISGSNTLDVLAVEKEMAERLETCEIALDQVHEQRAEAKKWLEAIDSQLVGLLEDHKKLVPKMADIRE